MQNYLQVNYPCKRCGSYEKGYSQTETYTNGEERYLTFCRQCGMLIEEVRWTTTTNARPGEWTVFDMSTRQ